MQMVAIITLIIDCGLLGFCKNGANCTFAHGPVELRVRFSVLIELVERIQGRDFRTRSTITKCTRIQW